MSQAMNKTVDFYYHKRQCPPEFRLTSKMIQISAALPHFSLHISKKQSIGSLNVILLVQFEHLESYLVKIITKCKK